MRHYAEDTQVPVTKSRGEIDQLLQRFGADGIQWTDEFSRDRAVLRFVWPHEGHRYMARFSVQLLSKAELMKAAVDNRNGQPSQAKLDKLLSARGRQEHRLLLLWLKAALNAVEAGLVKAEELFLPFLEGKDGKTVGEVAVSRLVALLDGSATKMLGA